ncbi:hypothetical protein LMB54_07835 [Limosilactobacillus reuteri]|uniref:hypothetical protein n=1 Tax=Limosilactobacillus reuteri TaxID=1598 RepID=UPI001E398B23|nr:hypothetical protein [Limosilactobacillus reuteri]MCC4383713.1 hypothetical protein [Limosilactobacillus reuteri]MCC4420967.1 hypothetical protein [Limosilactobacillus reuteri]
MNKKKRKAKRELTKAYKERINRQSTHNLLVEALSNEVKAIVTNYSQNLRELAKIFEK